MRTASLEEDIERAQRLGFNDCASHSTSSNASSSNSSITEASNKCSDVKMERYPRLMRHLPTYSLSWWLMPMTTLGLSTLLSSQQSLHTFDGLRALGLIVYFLGLAQYTFVLIAQLTRFIAVPEQFKHALSSSEETMFAAAFVISCYGILAGAAVWAQPLPGSRLSYCFIAFFWIYLVLAFVATLTLYFLIFEGGHLQDKNMTPAWLLPILPTILVGSLAGDLAKSTFPAENYALLVAGIFCSGFGFLISLSLWAIYIHRLFVDGLPDQDQRPGMMIAVGPATYAPAAWMKLVAAIPPDYGYFAGKTITIAALEAMTLLGSIAAVGVGIFFMLMAFISVVKGARRISFHLTWYGLIFPNIGLVEAVGAISLMLPSAGMTWVASVATVLLVALWLFVSCSHLRWMILYNTKQNS